MPTVEEAKVEKKPRGLLVEVLRGPEKRWWKFRR
jgi:hypothetical protein